MDAYETLLLDERDGILCIRLNRPDALNALNAAMKRELLQAVRHARRSASVRVVMLCGAGRGFCAGEDLKSHAGEPDRSLGRSLREDYNPLIEAICDLPKPVVAVVGGVAAGAGMSLALAADMRLLGRSARLISAFGRIGLVPDCGLTYLLPRLVGLGRAMEITMLAQPVGAEQALSIGLCNQVHPDEQLEQAAQQLCQQLARGPVQALGRTKQALRRGLEMSLKESLAYEASLQELSGRGAEYREGQRAFLEKRPPDYRGVQ